MSWAVFFGGSDNSLGTAFGICYFCNHTLTLSLKQMADSAMKTENEVQCPASTVKVSWFSI
jgi:hypothetical protein